jgi:hypothetical protein
MPTIVDVLLCGILEKKSNFNTIIIFTKIFWFKDGILRLSNYVALCNTKTETDLQN